MISLSPLTYFQAISIVLRRTVLILLALSLAACSKQPEGMLLVSGEVVDRQALKGKWVLINYWAEWCKPCLEEIPEFNRFAKEQAPVARVFGVNFDGLSAQELVRQVDKLSIDFEVLAQDPSVSWGFERPAVLPATYVFNPQGQLQQVLLGPQSHASLMDAIGAVANGVVGNGAVANGAVVINRSAAVLEKTY